VLNIQIPTFFKDVVDSLNAVPANSGQALMTVAGAALIGCTDADHRSPGRSPCAD